jgi:hypothetical protein
MFIPSSIQSMESQFKSNQTRSNQSVAPSVRNTTNPEHAPVISSILTRTNHQICPKSLRNVSVQIKPDQTSSNQIKCCVPRFETQLTRNTTTDQPIDYDLDKFKICPSHWGVTRDQTSSNQINCAVLLGLKHNRLRTQPPIIPIDYDLDKFNICLSHWGVTRVYSVQIKITFLNTK